MFGFAKCVYVCRLTDGIALDEIHLNRSQCINNFLRLDEFRNSLQPEDMADLIDRAHHDVINWIIEDAADKHAIDFQAW